MLFLSHPNNKQQQQQQQHVQRSTFNIRLCQQADPETKSPTTTFEDPSKHAPETCLSTQTDFRPPQTVEPQAWLHLDHLRGLHLLFCNQTTMALGFPLPGVSATVLGHSTFLASDHAGCSSRSLTVIVIGFNIL